MAQNMVRLVICKQMHASIRATVVICHCKGTAHASPGPVMALRFHPAFWDDAEGKVRTHFPWGILKWISSYFRRSLARGGEPPCYREAVGSSSV